MVRTLPPLLLGLLCTSATADGFRCGNGRLVSEGDRLYEVRARCGEPDFATQRVELRKITNRFGQRTRRASGEAEVAELVEITIDEWTYDLGRNRLVRHLLFEDGRLQSVTTGRRGVQK